MSATSLLFVLRHCTRLGQVNPDWLRASVSEHNPQISWGGWVEGVKLGEAVGRLSREDQAARNRPDVPPVAIYTAPAITCLQSSAAAAVGSARSLPGDDRGWSQEGRFFFFFFFFFFGGGKVEGGIKGW